MIGRLFAERELAEEAADRWWMFLVTGIGWLVFALLVFQWDYTTIYAISILFGIVALVAGANEFFQIMVSSTGWKIVHGILGVLFVITGVWALRDLRSAFTTLAALVAFFLLFEGIFDLTVAFMTKDEFDLWWLQLIPRHRRDRAGRSGSPARSGRARSCSWSTSASSRSRAGSPSSPRVQAERPGESGSRRSFAPT